MSKSDLIENLAYNSVKTGVAGALVGASFGGVGGTIVGMIPLIPCLNVGVAGYIIAALGLGADSLIIIPATALGAATGAVIGTVVGSTAGAAYTLYHYDYYSNDVMGAHKDTE
jgi:hypothetical protein